jgi:hypothetical protein
MPPDRGPDWRSKRPDPPVATSYPATVSTCPSPVFGGSEGRLRQLRLRIKPAVLEGIITESFAVAGFDELAHRELPALVRAGTQARELLWIHAESARHLDLPSIEFADPLCISPNFLIIPSTLRRHAYTPHCRNWSSAGLSFPDQPP